MWTLNSQILPSPLGNRPAANVRKSMVCLFAIARALVVSNDSDVERVISEHVIRVKEENNEITFRIETVSRYKRA